MKPDQESENDGQLRKVLHEWTVNAGLPPRFQEEVWKRIGSANAAVAPNVWTVVVHWIGTALARPAMAGAYLAILLIVGGTAGWTHGRQEAARVKGELGQRYVRVLDPYQFPRH